MKATKKPPRKWTSKELKQRIQGRHPSIKSWFTTTELCPACGSWGAAGSIDAVAVCMSVSHDFAVHGFEVKVARGDWLSELNNPSKSDLAISEVDYWWIVAPSTDIVKVEELPPKWGLYTCSGKGLRVTKRATRLHETTKPFSRAFIASLLWKVTKYVPPDEKAIEDARAEGRKRGQEDGERWAHTDKGDDHQELLELQHVVEAFEKNAGQPLSRYNAGEIGHIVDLMSHDYRIKSVRARIAEMVEKLTDADKELAAGFKVAATGDASTKAVG